MSVEIFTKEEFEAALPRHKETQEPLWTCEGVHKGEYVYHVSFNHPQEHAILVRSSVKSDGVSAATGQDSIRLLLISTKQNQLIASKLSKYVTRVTGWQDRLLEQLRFLARIGMKLNLCDCGSWQVSFKVKKEGPNKGKFFKTCIHQDCNRTKFAFLTDEKGELV
ncbi:MAG: hypothetical protein ACW99G_12905 [Candidatus Thorarchaeota archaeon]|jgi:hypothetical protein